MQKNVRIKEFKLYGITLIDIDSLFTHCVRPYVITAIINYEIEETYQNKDYRNILEYYINKELDRIKIQGNTNILVINECYNEMFNHINVHCKTYSCKSFDVIDSMNLPETHQLLNELKGTLQKPLYFTHFKVKSFK